MTLVARSSRLVLAVVVLATLSSRARSAHAQDASPALSFSAATTPAVEPGASADTPRATLRVTELLDPNAPPMPRPERQRPQPRVGPWVLMGVGGGSMLSSLVLFVLHNQAMAGCSVENAVLSCESPAELSRAAEAPALNTATWLTAGAGFASITGGFIWWFARRAPPPVTTAFAPLPGGGTVLFGGRF